MLEISGQTVGKYLILERVGHGGMSAIYKALDTSKDTPVALKVLSAAMASDATFEARFSREIEVLRTLDHSNILPILDYGDIAGLAYIIMPFYEHGTLQDRINKGISLKNCSKVLAQVSEALAYAHSHGITHRDVKPTNILLDEKGNAVLSDFGFAHMSDSSLSLTGSALIGTPAYMSPEQCRGEDINGASDQYSLGIVAFQMVTGKAPFEADTPMALVFKHLNDPVPNPRDINPRVPEEVEDVILKALNKDPKRRYASVAAFNQAFQVALAPQRSSLPEAALRIQRVRNRFMRARRRISQTFSRISSSPLHMRRVRLGLTGAATLALPLTVWALGTMGLIPGNADAALDINPTDIAATVIAGFEANNPGGDGMSADEMSTAVAATVSAFAGSDVGGGLRATATPTPGGEDIPTATPTSTPTNTPWPYVPPPTRTPYVPPTPRPYTMHVADLAGNSNGNSSNWRASVTIWVVRDDGANVGGATVSGSWSVSGTGVSTVCVTGGNGRCKVDSGSLSAASTTFTVSSVYYTGYIYRAEDNAETTIVVISP